MLAQEFGALRPWEMRLLTPYEERQVHAMRAELERRAQEV
jgi:hypothetical protein